MEDIQRYTSVNLPGFQSIQPTLINHQLGADTELGNTVGNTLLEITIPVAMSGLGKLQTTSRLKPSNSYHGYHMTSVIPLVSWVGIEILLLP